MSEKFREIDKAIAYVAGGLQKTFPKARAEVMLVHKTRPVSETCDICDIGTVLERLCKNFGSGRVHFHPDNPYGFVAEIRGRGDESSRQIGARTLEPPRVVVLLADPDGVGPQGGARYSPPVETS